MTATAVARAVRQPAATGRPRVDAALRARVAEWVREERDLPAGEIWRRLREAGHR